MMERMRSGRMGEYARDAKGSMQDFMKGLLPTGGPIDPTEALMEELRNRIEATMANSQRERIGRSNLRMPPGSPREIE